jgi:hypothetical protein
MDLRQLASVQIAEAVVIGILFLAGRLHTALATAITPALQYAGGDQPKLPKPAARLRQTRALCRPHRHRAAAGVKQQQERSPSKRACATSSLAANNDCSALTGISCVLTALSPRRPPTPQRTPPGTTQACRLTADLETAGGPFLDDTTMPVRAWAETVTSQLWWRGSIATAERGSGTDTSCSDLRGGRAGCGCTCTIS